MDSDELMDLYGIPADQRAGLLRAADDLAGAFGATSNTSAMRALLTAMSAYDTEPLKSFGVLVRRRWWERPYWLWRKSIQRRIQSELSASARTGDRMSNPTGAAQ